MGTGVVVGGGEVWEVSWISEEEVMVREVIVVRVI